MKPTWQSLLNYDPIIPLLESDNKPIRFFTKRDLLNETNGNTQNLWNLSEAQKIIHKQQKDGSWKYPIPKTRVRTVENYNQLETFRQLGFLVEMFGFDKRSSVIAQAAEYLFSFQTDKGDIRGILGNQYAPYYTAAIMELLIKAGYDDDPRIIKAFKWLNGIRQNDGGWAIPLRTMGEKLDIISMNAKTLEPDLSKPSSHLITGVVLRAYAAHPNYRKSQEARRAGEFLLKSLFKADKYTDRSSKDYWLKFTFPFWFTDLISALDSLSLLGFTRAEPEIQKALQWYIKNQQPGGLWKLKILKNPHLDNDLWLSLAICRILKRLHP